MTTMINPSANGRRRGSLNEQIDRLDSMLEGLSEGLTEAVADAVRIGVNMPVKEAVHAVLMEVLTNPEIRAKLSVPLATVAPAEAPKRVGWWQRIRACIAGLRETCAEMFHGTKSSVSNSWHATCAHVAAWRDYGAMLAPFKYQILLALTIGTLVGVGIWYAGPWISAAVSGVGTFCTTLALQAGLWVRRNLVIEHEELV